MEYYETLLNNNYVTIQRLSEINGDKLGKLGFNLSDKMKLLDSVQLMNKNAKKLNKNKKKKKYKKICKNGDNCQKNKFGNCIQYHKNKHLITCFNTPKNCVGYKNGFCKYNHSYNDYEHLKQNSILELQQNVTTQSSIKSPRSDNIVNIVMKTANNIENEIKSDIQKYLVNNVHHSVGGSLSELSTDGNIIDMVMQKSKLNININNNMDNNTNDDDDTLKSNIQQYWDNKMRNSSDSESETIHENDGSTYETSTIIYKMNTIASDTTKNITPNETDVNDNDDDGFISDMLNDLQNDITSPLSTQNNDHNNNNINNANSNDDTNDEAYIDDIADDLQMDPNVNTNMLTAKYQKSDDYFIDLN